MTKSNKNTVLISIGCNINRDKQIKKVRKCLSGIFPDIHFTRSLTSPACPGDGVYSNMLAELKTELPEQDLVTRLKQLEQEMGDSAEQRKLGQVMMDLDILRYNNDKRHEDDWERHYIKRLLRYTMRVVVILMTVAFSHSFSYASSFQEQNKTSDADLLGKAIEYYQGGKYHESILAFERLNSRYKLNARFIAYLGMSYFKENQYEEAAKYLKASLPELEAYSPYERAVYTYSCAESFFYMEKYHEAITYYNMALPLTNGNNRADILFHNAFAHYLTEGVTDTVKQLFSDALQTYKDNTATATQQQAARLKQTENMLRAMQHAEP